MGFVARIGIWGLRAARGVKFSLIAYLWFTTTKEGSNQPYVKDTESAADQR